MRLSLGRAGPMLALALLAVLSVPMSLTAQAPADPAPAVEPIRDSAAPAPFANSVMTQVLRFDVQLDVQLDLQAYAIDALDEITDPAIVERVAPASSVSIDSVDSADGLARATTLSTFMPLKRSEPSVHWTNRHGRAGTGSSRTGEAGLVDHAFATG
jgi:hypothetical protein